jgi:hexosaminidase
MKRIVNALLMLLFTHFFTGCSDQNSETSLAALKDVKVFYEVVSNLVAETPQVKSRLLMVNLGEETLGSENWELYFNQAPRVVVDGSVSENAQLDQLSGDFFRLKPTGSFRLAPGDTAEVSWIGQEWLIKESDAPLGLYFVTYDEEGKEENIIEPSYEILPFNRPEQVKRHVGEKTLLPTPMTRFKENATLTMLDPGKLPPVLPAPVKFSALGGNLKLDQQFRIFYEDGLLNEAAYLQSFLQKETGLQLVAVKGNESGANRILLKTGQVKVNGTGREAYNLEIRDGISITGSDAAGVFYGIQSLLKMVSVDAFQSKSGEIQIPRYRIEDAPAFNYRGMHLDVVRHFHPMEEVKKLLDLMAAYKLNKFLFNFTEDEGWRVEIEELPELTEVGSVRGHTLTEESYLHPSYGSGPDPEDNESGSGFYTRAQFKEIIRYAHDRHIEVIPEVNFPGHSRAAIIAMNARYRRLMDEGKAEEAEAYRLIDPADQSKYFSAQHYTDNTVSVCRESVYRFYETVLDDIIEMYQEAEVPLNMFHAGGDEVPHGAWTASPLCDKFMAENAEYNDPAKLQAYFFSRLLEITEKRGLKVGGWEEVAMIRNDQGQLVVNPVFKDQNVVPYVWNTLSGSQDLGNRLANAGYPVVLCNVTNLYFDLAYNRDPKEPGLYWGGFVDTRKAFELIPYDVLKSMQKDPMGRTYNPEEDFAGLENLKPENRQLVLGLQGQLWSESIRDGEMLQYYYLPKILGLAERAWVGQPSWASTENQNEREQQLEEAWNVFANVLGQRELPRLNHMFGGYNFRVPLPGLQVSAGELQANVLYPGLEIRFTTDGTEPDQNSTLYTGPVKVDGTVKAKAFTPSGHSSRVSETEANPVQLP